MYTGLFTSNSITPLLTLPNSTKLVSVVAVNVYLLRVSVNLSLSAPAAFSFVVPCELSSRVVSVPAPTSSSTMSRPILKEGLPLYFSNTIVCASTLTKYPLKNTTPSFILAIDERPTGERPDAATLNSLLFDAVVIAPAALTLTSIISSEGLNLSDGFVDEVSSVPCCKYLTI